jgi:hypothetical protein
MTMRGEVDHQVDLITFEQRFDKPMAQPGDSRLQVGDRIRRERLRDGSSVNFLYEMNGLPDFDYEYQRVRWLKWLGTEVAILPFARI